MDIISWGENDFVTHVTIAVVDNLSLKLMFYSISCQVIDAAM